MSLKRKEILVIDDDPDIIELLATVLTSAGMKIHKASCLDDAQKSMEHSVPHLIILDIKLGAKESGFQFLKNKNQQPHYKDIPVIILSAANNKKSITQSQFFGVRDYIVKPLNPYQVLRKIKKNLLSYKTITHTYNSDDKPIATLRSAGELASINELSIRINSPVKFARDCYVNLEASLLTELKAEISEQRSVGESRVIDVGRYQTEITFVGITEKTARMIRKYRTSKI